MIITDGRLIDTSVITTLEVLCYSIKLRVLSSSFTIMGSK